MKTNRQTNELCSKNECVLQADKMRRCFPSPDVGDDTTNFAAEVIKVVNGTTARKAIKGIQTMEGRRGFC